MKKSEKTPRVNSIVASYPIVLVYCQVFYTPLSAPDGSRLALHLIQEWNEKKAKKA